MKIHRLTWCWKIKLRKQICHIYHIENDVLRHQGQSKVSNAVIMTCFTSWLALNFDLLSTATDIITPLLFNIITLLNICFLIKYWSSKLKNNLVDNQVIYPWKLFYRTKRLSSCYVILLTIWLELLQVNLVEPVCTCQQAGLGEL